MKPKKYKVMIDIYKGVLNNQVIEFTTQDNGSNVLEFEILEDKVTPYNLDGCIVRMVINGQQQDCTIVDGANGQVKIVLLQSMFSQVGLVTAELQIYDATNQTLRLTTPRFRYNVKKSLMDDETVQADPNYSILQNMILEVTGANEIADKAKTTAEAALTKSNQAVTTINNEVAKVNKAVTDAQTALDRAESVVTQEELAQKVMLDGKDTKFDFIKDKVAPDGLIKAINNTPISKQLLEGCKSFIVRVSTANKIVADTLILNQGLLFGSLVNQVGLRDYPGSYSCVTDCSQTSDVIYYCEVTENRVLVINLRDNTKKERINSEGKKIEYVESTKNDYKLNAFFYNRPLTLQEIQYMFSVLNNSPSIKELHTTDSTGKTSILKLASDEDHVEMASGRTLREEYMGVLKAMGKEVPSADGSPVKVPNGIEARVINAEIKGQTVKNEFYALPNNIRFSNGMMVLSGSISGVQQQQKESTFNKCIGILKPNTVYSVVLDVIETNYTQPMVFGVGNTVDIDVSTTGIKVGKFTTPSSVTGDTLITLQNKVADQVAGRKIAFKFGFYEGDLTIKNPIKSPKFGLSSTQAIISNNCEPYPIYANEEDETNKKVISLPFEEDKVTLNDDGSATWIKAGETNLVLTGVENWVLQPDYSSDITLTCMCDLNVSKKDNVVICDKLNYITTPELKSKRGVYGGGWNGAIYMSLLKTELETADLSGFKKWLSINKPSFTYMIESHVTTHIPKELMPTILTDKTNILEVGGAVKPSSFKVTVPVDRIAEIEARLQALESTTVDVVLNK